MQLLFFFFNDTATTEIYTLSPTRRSSDLLWRSRRPCGSPSRPREGRPAAFYGYPYSVSRAGSACSPRRRDRKSTRLNSSHSQISYAVFCLKKKHHSHLPTTLATSAPPPGQ